MHTVPKPGSMKLAVKFINLQEVCHKIHKPYKKLKHKTLWHVLLQLHNKLVFIRLGIGLWRLPECEKIPS